MSRVGLVCGEGEKGPVPFFFGPSPRAWYHNSLLGDLCKSPRRLGKIEMSDTLGAGLHTP